MIRIKKSTIVCFALLASSFYAFAQQDAQYSQYMFNSLVINPAYAGYKESLNISALHRDQWAGVEGGPKTQSLVVDGSFFDDKVGLGLSIVNDKVGLQRQSSAFVNYAYRLKVGADATLAFGLGAGVGQYTVNALDANVDDMTDPNFMGGNSSYFAPDIRAGIHFSNDKFYVGFSTTNLLSQSLDYGNANKNLIVKQGRHFFLTAGYLVDITDFLKFKPSFLVKEDTKGPTNLDVNSFFLLGEKVWVGASYRTSVNLLDKTGVASGVKSANAVVGMVELYTGNGWRLGYAYDYSLSSIKGYTGSTHEISLGLTLGGKKQYRILSPRYF